MRNKFKTSVYVCSLLLNLILFSCDVQKDYQAKKVEQHEKMVATPNYKSIGYGYESLPSSLSKNIADQRQSFVELLKNYQDECLTLVHLYHPQDINIESIGLCIKTQEQNVGIYQANACVVAIIDHVYQKPMPYYSEKSLHWGIQKACSHEAMLNKINAKDTLTTVNPFTYAKMKIQDDRFSLQIVQDRLDLALRIKKIISP